jgi:hypothetical protein
MLFVFFFFRWIQIDYDDVLLDCERNDAGGLRYAYLYNGFVVL